MQTTILLLFLNLFAFHPIHLTVTNIEYNKKTKNFEISIRLFVNDFEKIIYLKNGVQLNIGRKNENPKANSYINKYIKSHLQLTINNQQINPKKFKLKQKKKEDVTLWLYYNVKYKGTFNQITIKNSLMTDLFRDQKNLLIFTYNNKQTPLQFSYRKTSIKIKL
jgi:hypothetical protein